MKVRLSEYSKDWPLMFQDEAEKLGQIFGDAVLTFEHFGSTSVPGLKAKPVIDMMCIVKNIEIIDTYNSKMESLGYDVAGEWGIEGRRLFRKGGEKRTHHIHVYQVDNPQINRHLIFRDYLRLHPEEVQLYAKFKEKLASQFEQTSGYSPAKKKFVTEMEKRALEWNEQNK